jgi:hypothetical protein
MNKSWQLRVLSVYLALGAPLGASCAKEANTLEPADEGNGGSSMAGTTSAKSGSTGKGGATGAFGGTNAKSGSAGMAMADGGEEPVAEGGQGTGGSAGSSGGGGMAGNGGGGGSGGVVGVPPDVLDRASVILRYASSDASASTTKIFAWMFLINQSDDPLPLANVKVRYWFTSEAAAPVLSGPYKGSNITSYTNTFVLDAAKSHILTTFGGGSINKGSDINLNEFQLQIDGGTQNQSNDWSFEPAYVGRAANMPHDKITVYLDEKLIWGCEPPEAGGACFDDDAGAGGNGAGGAN